MADEKPKTFKKRLTDFLTRNHHEVLGRYHDESELLKAEAEAEAHNEGLEEGYQAGFKAGADYFYELFHQLFKEKSYSEMEVYEVLDIVSDTSDDINTEVGE